VVDGRKKILGYCDDEQDAARLYNNSSNSAWKECAEHSGMTQKKRPAAASAVKSN
jgi:hypothetical protein